jgi:hypothetical protein
VRVRADAHAAAGLETGRASVIKETPGADHAPLPRGQQAVDRDAAADLRHPRVDALD